MQSIRRLRIRLSLIASRWRKSLEISISNRRISLLSRLQRRSLRRIGRG
jgi:hypothetical protein